MTKGEEKFGKVFTHRVIITPKISKNLAHWMMEGYIEGRFCDGLVDGDYVEVWIYEFEVEDIIEAWENEEVPPEIVKELSEFVQYLQDEKVDYISFPEGL